MRARIREACDGLGWFLGPAAVLLGLAVLNFLLIAQTEAGVDQPITMTTGDWVFLLVPATLGVGVLVAGFVHRYVERHPRLEDFGFGYGIDPQFLEQHLSSPERIR